MCIRDREIIEKHCEKFGIPYKKVGSLQIGADDTVNSNLDYMNCRANERGIKGVRIVKEDEIYKIEPNLKPGITKALYSRNTAVIPPYDLATSYAEIAADNGVSFRLEEIVPVYYTHLDVYKRQVLRMVLTLYFYILIILKIQN